MSTRSARPPRLAALITAGLLVLVLGIWLGGHPSWLPAPLRSAFVDDSKNDQIIDQVLSMLQRDYYRPINRTTLVNKGLAAAVASLNDPYSHYFDPTDYEAFQNETDPHLSGIGIDVDNEKKGLRVVDVFPGTPAAHAGLSRGDVITEVGTTPLANRSAVFSSERRRGRQ